ncbi:MULTISPECIES: MoxR family ATPase [unclassified Cupriavidus]|uniref:AAA family ATPase n=1 Tax=unclassified Cupriavidus TaxID=2640874 RepID=UPI001AE1FB5A|nr:MULTISPECIES: MoxR family ATPase [unclassified Cupriavidus]MBP0630165.1 MoxR family ATPase [Cupriavidus sp. AcVe19-1a]MBP0637823.1 MoxR family ATPase [Cupriavidus sp. AcVe19-6a]
MSTRDDVLALQQRMGEAIVGQQRMIERMLLGLLADGHLLVEGLPGLAKTRAIKVLARNLEAKLSRIQFTPDLLPADVTGSEVYYTEGGKGEFRFQAGPIFANLVLADEVNRSPAKVQAALLEAMEERQVTVGGVTHKLDPLFLVMATQNPIEQEGTYPLPEAQMDRFLMHVNVTYPEADAEAQIVALARAEEAGAATGAQAGSVQRLAPEVIFAARAEIHGIHVSEAVARYMVALVHATREPKAVDDELDRWIQVGASPRGSIGLDKVARAHAWLRGQDFVSPEDVQAVVHEVFRHRLILSYEAHAAGVSADAVIDRLVQQVAVA